MSLKVYIPRSVIIDLHGKAVQYIKVISLSFVQKVAKLITFSKRNKKYFFLYWLPKFLVGSGYQPESLHFETSEKSG